MSSAHVHAEDQLTESVGQGCASRSVSTQSLEYFKLTRAGNGCQKAFYEDPNILYISLHVHMDGRFYPSGPEGDMYHCGNGPGVGK